jgi:hypothetical protein
MTVEPQSNSLETNAKEIAPGEVSLLEAAEMLGVNYATLRRYEQAGVVTFTFRVNLYGQRARVATASDIEAIRAYRRSHPRRSSCKRIRGLGGFKELTESGRHAASAWVNETAEYLELKRLTALSNEGWPEGVLQADYVAATATATPMEKFTEAASTAFWKRALGHHPEERLQSEEFLHGFVDAAVEGYHEVEDEEACYPRLQTQRREWLAETAGSNDQ